MTIKEIELDVFDAPGNYVLAHCISNDLALGKGIATEFNQMYSLRDRLNKSYPDRKVGDALLCDDVFNLVTKEHYYDKPTYKTLWKALESMREQMEDMYLYELAMPRIGCGLDKLKWEKVKEIIIDVFEDTRINILICTLPQKS